MLKHYDFECAKCGKTFDDYVEGVDGMPEKCAHCTSKKGFKKIPSTFVMPTHFILDYPGSKRLKAGYVHTHARPAEKKESQVSMYTPKARK
jgi:DNA-directed RNA polymerase subunit RPC12/RpoP